MTGSVGTIVPKLPGKTSVGASGLVSQIHEALEVRDPAIKVVISQRVDLNAHQVHYLDCRHVAELVGDRGRCPERIAGGERDGIRIGRAVDVPVGGYGRSAADLRGSDQKRIDLAMPV